MTRKYKVVYLTKNENGYIIEHRRSFAAFCGAVLFLQELRLSGKLVGKPELI